MSDGDLSKAVIIGKRKVSEVSSYNYLKRVKLLNSTLDLIAYKKHSKK